MNLKGYTFYHIDFRIVHLTHSFDDSFRLRTNVYVCYQPAVIACAVLWLAARIAQVKLPTSPPWWELFEAELEDILLKEFYSNFLFTFFFLI